MGHAKDVTTRCPRHRTMTTTFALAEIKASEVRSSFAQQALMRTIGAGLTSVAPGRRVITLRFGRTTTWIPPRRRPWRNRRQRRRLCDAHTIAVGGGASMLEYKINSIRPAAGDYPIAESCCVLDDRFVSPASMSPSRARIRARCALPRNKASRAFLISRRYHDCSDRTPRPCTHGYSFTS